MKPRIKALADMLRLTPLLATHADGRISPGGVLFGRGNLPAKFARFIARRLRSDRRYAIGIGHADAGNAANELLERLQHAHPGIESSFLMPVGSALSVHGGPGTLVVWFREL